MRKNVICLAFTITCMGIHAQTTQSEKIDPSMLLGTWVNAVDASDTLLFELTQSARSLIMKAPGIGDNRRYTFGLYADGTVDNTGIYAHWGGHSCKLSLVPTDEIEISIASAEPKRYYRVGD